jgi:hypothetical protein
MSTSTTKLFYISIFVAGVLCLSTFLIEYLAYLDYGYNYAPLVISNIQSHPVSEQRINSCQPSYNTNNTYPYCTPLTVNQACVLSVTDMIHLYNNQQNLVDYFNSNLYLCQSSQQNFTQMDYTVGFYVDSSSYTISLLTLTCIIEDRKCTQRYSLGQHYNDGVHRYVEYYKYKPELNRLSTVNGSSVSSKSYIVSFMFLIFFVLYFSITLGIYCYRKHTSRHSQTEEYINHDRFNTV